MYIMHICHNVHFDSRQYRQSVWHDVSSNGHVILWYANNFNSSDDVMLGRGGRGRRARRQLTPDKHRKRGDPERRRCISILPSPRARRPSSLNHHPFSSQFSGLFCASQQFVPPCRPPDKPGSSGMSSWSARSC